MDMRFTCVDILSQMQFVRDFLSMLGSTPSVEMAGKPCLYRCLCSLLVCAAMVSPVTALLGIANSFRLTGMLYMISVWLLSLLCVLDVRRCVRIPVKYIGIILNHM